MELIDHAGIHLKKVEMDDQVFNAIQSFTPDQP